MTDLHAHRTSAHVADKKDRSVEELRALISHCRTHGLDDRATALHILRAYGRTK